MHEKIFQVLASIISVARKASNRTLQETNSARTFSNTNVANQRKCKDVCGEEDAAKLARKLICGEGDPCPAPCTPATPPCPQPCVPPCPKPCAPPCPKPCTPPCPLPCAPPCPPPCAEPCPKPSPCAKKPTEKEKGVCDIYQKIPVLREDEDCAVEKYFGECYQNKEYYLYTNYAFYDVEKFMMQYRCPQPSATTKKKDCKM